jgi:hypothetical protein
MLGPTPLKENVSSKKFIFAIFAVLICFGYALLAATKVIELKSMFDAFTGLVEFVVAAYLAGNVGNKIAVGWSLKKKKKLDIKTDAKP